MSLRSYLFVPGNRPERFEKALNAGADVVILDLEDAVPSDQKDAAREAVLSWLTPEHPVYVRVNGVNTDWFEADCMVLGQSGLRGVVLPKAECSEHIGLVAGLVRRGVKIVPLIESALGLSNARDLAAVPGVERLAFGSVDFQLDTGISGEVEELLYARSHLVLASRVAGVDSPVDGVSLAIDDEESLRSDVARAKRMGFGAKLCIHPRQVAIINEGFIPDEGEIRWAQAIIDAIGVSGEGTIKLEGKLVDRPVIERARKLLELTE